MAIVAVLFMFLAIWLGISLGSWDIAIYGVLPLGVGIFFACVALYQEKKLKEYLENNPDKAREVDEIMKKYR